MRSTSVANAQLLPEKKAMQLAATKRYTLPTIINWYLKHKTAFHIKAATDGCKCNKYISKWFMLSFYVCLRMFDEPRPAAVVDCRNRQFKIVISYP